MKKIATTGIVNSLIISLIIFASFCWSGCSEEAGYPTFPLQMIVYVFMENQSADPVHLWINPSNGFVGEKIGPNNQVSSEMARVKTIALYWENESSIETLSISVGRNGKAFLTTVKEIPYHIRDGGNADTYTATYDQITGKLTIDGCMIIFPINP